MLADMFQKLKTHQNMRRTKKLGKQNHKTTEYTKYYQVCHPLGYLCIFLFIAVQDVMTIRLKDKHGFRLADWTRPYRFQIICHDIEDQKACVVRYLKQILSLSIDIQWIMDASIPKMALNTTRAVQTSPSLALDHRRHRLTRNQWLCISSPTC